jgi:hypothetical protein
MTQSLPPAAADLLASVRRSTSDGVLRLAYHAALPVVIDAGLLNLLRVNFFLDPPDALPFEAEADLLLSPLFREIGDDLYEIEPAIRNILLTGLQTRYGSGRVRQVALLLETYTESTPAWTAQPELEQAQRLTVLSFVKPAVADAWLGEVRHGGKAAGLPREWFVAMRQRLAAQSADVAAAELAAAIDPLASADMRMNAIRRLGALAQLPDVDTELIVADLATMVQMETAGADGPVTPEVQAALVLIGALPHRNALDLARVELTMADLHGLNLSGAIMTGAVLTDCRADSADLSETNLSRAVLVRVTADRANLAGADLRYATLDGVSFRNAILARADLSDARLSNVDFTGAQLPAAMPPEGSSPAEAPAAESEPGDEAPAAQEAFTVAADPVPLPLPSGPGDYPVPFRTFREGQYVDPTGAVVPISQSPATVAAGQTVWLLGSDLGVSGVSDSVYLLPPAGAEVDVTPWVVASESSGAKFVLTLPATAGAPPGGVPAPGVYQFRVGSGAPGSAGATRSEATPVSIAASVDPSAGPLLSGPAPFTVTGTGFIPGATEVLVGTAALTEVTMPPRAGEFSVAASGTSFAFSPPAGPAGTVLAVRVRVNSVESDPALWVNPLWAKLSERVMLVRVRADQTQIVVLTGGTVTERYAEDANDPSRIGNIYLGKVQNVLPSMEAAFVNIGLGRNAVLYAGDVDLGASGLEGKPRRIESALTSGQSVIVQVLKESAGSKGARLTSRRLSLAGRNLTYVPGGNTASLSRKLPAGERTRLKPILRQVMPEGAGLIARDTAEGASEEELARDVARLAAQWQSIERKARTTKAPALLYHEPAFIIRVIRDVFTEHFTKLVVAGDVVMTGDSEWEMAEEYVHYVAPHLASRLERWTDSEDLFAAYRVGEQDS